MNDEWWEKKQISYFTYSLSFLSTSILDALKFLYKSSIYWNVCFDESLEIEWRIHDDDPVIVLRLHRKYVKPHQTYYLHRHI